MLSWILRGRRSQGNVAGGEMAFVGETREETNVLNVLSVGSVHIWTDVGDTCCGLILLFELYFLFSSRNTILS